MEQNESSLDIDPVEVLKKHSELLRAFLDSKAGPAMFFAQLSIASRPIVRKIESRIDFDFTDSIFHSTTLGIEMKRLKGENPLQAECIMRSLTCLAYDLGVDTKLVGDAVVDSLVERDLLPEVEPITTQSGHVNSSHEIHVAFVSTLPFDFGTHLRSEHVANKE